MNLLDADIFTLAHHGKPGVAGRVLAARDAGELVLPLPVRLEVLRGRAEAVLKAGTAADVIRMQGRLADAEAFLATFRVIPFDTAAGRHFGPLVRLKGLRNASIALARDATLVTRNVKDFRLVPNLRAENWAD